MLSLAKLARLVLLRELELLLICNIMPEEEVRPNFDIGIIGGNSELLPNSHRPL